MNKQPVKADKDKIQEIRVYLPKFVVEAYGDMDRKLTAGRMMKKVLLRHSGVVNYLED